MMYTIVFLSILSVTIAIPVQNVCGHFGCTQGQREQGVHNNDISIHRNNIDSTLNGLNADTFAADAAAAARHLNAAHEPITAIGSASAGPSIIGQNANTETLDFLSNGIESRFVGFDPKKLTAALNAAASSRTQKGSQSLSVESGLDSNLIFSWENPASVINPATATGFDANTIASATQDIRQTHVAGASHLARNSDVFNAGFGLNGKLPVAVISSDVNPHLVNSFSQPFFSNGASIQSTNIHQDGMVGLISSSTNHRGVSTSESNPNIEEAGKFVHFPNDNNGLLAELFTNVYNQNNPVVDQILVADTDAFRHLGLIGSSTNGGPSGIIGTQSLPSRKVGLF